MKRRFFGFTAVLVAAVIGAVFAGCASGGQQTQSSSAQISRNERVGTNPEFVQNIRKEYRAKGDYVGAGVAIFANDTDMARTFAEIRARAQIAREISTTVSNMVNDAKAIIEYNPKVAQAYQETVIRALANTCLQGAYVIDEDRMTDGNYWVVVVLPKETAEKSVKNAHSQASRAASDLEGGKRFLQEMESRMDEGLEIFETIDALSESNQTLTESNEDLQKELDQANRETTRAQDQVTKLQSQVKAAEEKLTQTELNAYYKAQAQAEEADKAARQAAVQQRRLDELKAELDRKTTQSQADRNALLKAQNETELARDKAAQAQREADASKAKFNEAQRQADREQTALKEAKSREAEANSKAAGALGALTVLQAQR
jgi:DNA repair exonuclease SbcCD ATPase subunit